MNDFKPTKITRSILLISLLLMMSTSLMAKMPSPDQTISYKITPQRELQLYIFYPEDQQNGKNRPVVISFFGGGWAGGNPNQFFDQSEYFASLGMVGISVDYRLIGTDNTTPFESVMDAKSAVRWVRKNRKMLGIDPNKIVTSGGSAGGHIALCTAIIEGVEDDKNLKIFSAPNAMILFNPVLNTTEQGYGADKLVGRETELSPVHHVRPNLPPMLIMHGTRDTTVPYQNAVDFCSAMAREGNDCRLVSAFGENHGFFNSPEFRTSCGERNYRRCMYESVKFLSDIGFISEELIPERSTIRVACVGNSITYGSRVEEREKNCYPTKLQSLMGEDYEVVNFGKPGATMLSNGNLPYTSTEEYRALLEYSPDIVIIKLGTNDSKLYNWSKSESFEEDYSALIKTLKSDKNRRPEIYICSPMPAFTPADSGGINNTRIVEEVIPTIKRVAKKSRLVYIDLYSSFENNASVFPDKIHPNAEGANRMANVIYNAIAQQEVVTR
ncbi:MAG: GDSL-type esterase/lipase family protein [Rikenellaceae bacterium]